jgi:putative acetyltransferase
MERDVVEVRPLSVDGVDASVALFEAVATEGRWIGREAPVDHDESRAYLQRCLDDPDAALFVAVARETNAQIGQIGLTLTGFGVVDLGMLVADGWRSRGVGSTLVAEALEWSRDRGAHKVALQVWPHNERAIGLYEKFGFEREGLLRQHYRRRNGELWDAVVMGLLLER